MTEYVIRRFFLALVTIWIVLTFVFFVLRVLPGDYAEQQLANQILATGARTEEARADQLRQIRARLGTDKSLPEQYGRFWWNILQGKSEMSFRKAQPAFTVAGDALPYTLQLGVMSLIIAVLLALPVGVLSAVRPDGFLDAALRVFAILFLAAPAFLTAAIAGAYAVKYDILNIGVTSQQLLWDSPWESFQLFIVPALAGGLAVGAILMRFLRSGMLEVLRQDYVRTARAKGLAGSVVIARHVLRNALIPVVTIFGFLVAALVAGNVVLESMFAIPGMGNEILAAIRFRDIPVTQTFTLLLVGAVVFVNLAVDLSYFLIDPRVTVSGAES
ncbi:MAG: ABC transporter permease [Dehalococcoidia bacterium]|nr:ABC transporter permease [Chloroflexota bacterium]MXW26074.1 ABC transporter permease [Dehalococcoidia bacterium]MXY88185.1 ABC transporter permease [Dehalococcoidia bacterium]MYA53255.1 ABC transporter permease [Dehalococcoidia bacterium]